MSNHPLKNQSLQSGSKPIFFPLKEKNPTWNNKLQQPGIKQTKPNNSLQRTPNDERHSRTADKPRNDNLLASQNMTQVYKNIIGSEPQHFFFKIDEIYDQQAKPAGKKGKTKSYYANTRSNENISSVPGDYSEPETGSPPPYASNLSPKKAYLQSTAGRDSSTHNKIDLSPIRHSTSPDIENLVDPDFTSQAYHDTDRIWPVESHIKRINRLISFDGTGSQHFQRHLGTSPKDSPRGLHSTHQSLANDDSSSPPTRSVTPDRMPTTNKAEGASHLMKSNSQSSKPNSMPNRSSSHNQLASRREQPQSEKLGSSLPSADTDIVSFVKKNLEFVTQCKEHLQPLTLFNPTTKQLGCIQCVYHQKEPLTRQNGFISFQNAFGEMAGHNKYFKLESKEKIFEIDSQLHVCKLNYSAIQDNLEYMFDSVSKEFNELHEQLRAREHTLIESLRSAAEIRKEGLKTKVENLEFLKVCYRDAKDVDPNNSVEQTVHFYAVFTLLKSVMANIGSYTQELNHNNLERVEFQAQKDIRTMIDKHGKVRIPKSHGLKKSSRDHRMSVENLGSVRRSDNRSLERTSASPIDGSTRRAITPGKIKSRDMSPSASYLERETLRNKLKSRATPESKSVKKSLDRSATEQSNVPVSSDKRETRGRLSKRKEVIYYPQTEPFTTSNTKLALLTKKGLHEHSPKGSRKQLQVNPIETESSERVKIHSPSEFISPTSQVGYANNAGKLVEPLMTSGMIRFQDTPERGAPIDFVKGSTKEYETVSFNGEGSLGVFGDSKILIDDDIKLDMIALFNDSLHEAKLIYRLSEDGASSNSFHDKCDGQSPLIVLVYANRHYVFGYYLPIPMEREEKYSNCEDSFIFTLRNRDLAGPIVFPIRDDKRFIALYQSHTSPCLGSTILNKQDLWLQFDDLSKSCSNIGYAYKLPAGINGSKALAGQYTDWNVQEIEVYKATF